MNLQVASAVLLVFLLYPKETTLAPALKKMPLDGPKDSPPAFPLALRRKRAPFIPIVKGVLGSGPIPGLPRLPVVPPLQK